MSFNNKNDKTKAFIETILTTIIMAIYIVMALYFIPIIGILYPIPFIILGVRNGMKSNILGILVSSVIVGLVTDVYTGLFIFVIFMPLTLILTYLIKTRKSSNEIVIISTLVFLVSCLFVIKITGRISGIDFINQIDETFKQVLTMQIDVLKDMQLSGYEMHRTQDLLKNTFEYMLLIVPSILIIFSLFICYLNYLISASVLRKLGHGIVSFPTFSYFRLPNNIIFGIIIIFLGTSLLKALKIFHYETVFLNVTVLTVFVFFLQGLSVIVFLLNKTRFNKVIRIIIVLFIIFIIPIGGFISILGFLDTIFNFRRIGIDI